MDLAREKLKNKYRNSKTPKEVVEVDDGADYSAEDSDEEYRRKRAAMAGPKLRVDEKDMQAIKVNEDVYDEA